MLKKVLTGRRVFASKLLTSTNAITNMNTSLLLHHQRSIFTAAAPTPFVAPSSPGHYYVRGRLCSSAARPPVEDFGAPSSINEEDAYFCNRTVELAMECVRDGGRPFATLVVKDGQIVTEAKNLVASTGDPTAHAEITAIRQASKVLGEDFTGCTFYIMSHPCPMCLGAMMHTNCDRVVFVAERAVVQKYFKNKRRYYDTEDEFYGEFGKPFHERKLQMDNISLARVEEVYSTWKQMNAAKK